MQIVTDSEKKAHHPSCFCNRMSRFYATFTRQTSHGPLKGSCFSYLFSSFQPQVFLDTEHGWSCLEGQLEEANRHTTREVCEVLSRHPRHPPLLPGSSRPLPPSPQLRRLVSSSTFSSIFFQKGLVISASVRAAAVGPDWRNQPSKTRSRFLGVSEVFPSQRLLCFLSDRKHGCNTTPPPTPTPISASPPAAVVDTAAFPMTPKAS